MMGVRCLARARLFHRVPYAARPAVAVIVNRGCREFSGAHSAKPKLWTLKDARERPPRYAKPKREEYLAARQAAFAAEQKKAEALGLDWAIRSALVLERLQIIVPDFEDWQIDFLKLQMKQRQNSAKGQDAESAKGKGDEDDTEATNPEDAETDETDDAEETQDTKATDGDFKAVEDLLADGPLPVAPRRTAADEANDRTSLDRALDARLVLIIKEKPGDPWRLPESPWEAGETIRQTAERTSKRILEKAVFEQGHEEDVTQLHFVGNCPAGWFWRTTDKNRSEKKGPYGDKVFINRAQLIKGNAAFKDSEVAEYLWVTKDEIGEYLSDSLGVYLKHML